MTDFPRKLQSTLYLGTNTHEKTVEDVVRNVGTKSMLVYMTNFTHSDAGTYLNKLARKFPNQRIFCGGPSTTGVKNEFENLVIKKDLSALLKAYLDS